MTLQKCLVLVLAGLAGAAQAAPAPILTPSEQAVIQQDPVAFLKAAATVTEWFADPRGMDAQTVSDFIAAQQADRRAAALAGLLKADLSGDGAVTRAEVDRIAPGLSPGARGKLLAADRKADADHDGQVSAAEVAAFAQAEALRLVPDQFAQSLQIMLRLDASADGWVTYDEIASAVAGLPVLPAVTTPKAACKAAICGYARHPRGGIKPLLPAPGSRTGVPPSSRGGA